MNSKKEVVPIRTRKGSIYQKGTNEVFKISRSKFSNFIDCPRCFYLERVKGLKDPIIFKTEPYRRDTSRLVYWCNPFEPINKGKLGSTQNWRINKPERSYY